MLSTTTRDGSGNCVSVALTAPNAAVNTYSYVFDHLDGTRDVYLSNQVDRYGRTNYYNYAVVNGKVHLTSVVDHNGRPTTFAYGNGSFPDAITQASDPWGHSVQLRYNPSGRLTNIVDAEMESLRIGQRVGVAFRPAEGGGAVPVFKPVEAT